jgi:prepilin-type N-terminal cleavage/methylation domain-containing protein
MSARVYPRGFTIVEVLIVLAISGVIMAATLPFISGKQSSTQYTVGINQLQAQISSLINNISNGNIPAAGSYSCTNSSNTVKVVTSVNGSNTGACQFIGEAIYFQKYSMKVIPIIGLRLNSSGLAQSLSDAKPCPMLNGGMVTCSSFDGSTTYSYTNGIILSKYNNNSISNSNGGLFAYFTLSSIGSLGQLNGSISVDSLNIPPVNTFTNPTDPGTSSANIFKLINGLSNINTYNITLDLCFYSSTTKTNGVITLSSNGNPVETKLINNPGQC